MIHRTEEAKSSRSARRRAAGASFVVGVALAVGCSNGEVAGGKGTAGADGGGTGAGGSSSGGAQPQGEGGSDVQTIVGTTGQACSTDSDCTSADGDTCSSDYPVSAAGVIGQSLPRPVCEQPPTSDNCDPAPAGDPFGEDPHFCDGPDDPSSPGICLPDNPTSPVSNQGTCMPKCTFATSGSAAVGCLAPDTCTPVIYAPLASGTIEGFGFCQGTCQNDSDCPAQSGVAATCQTDVGVCTTQPVARTLGLGDACTFDDYQAGHCNCDFDPDSGQGFCTTACVVGGTPCPTGWVCDTGIPSVVTIGNDSLTLATQNPGLAGICLPACPASAAVQSAAVVVDGGGDDAESDGSSPPSADATVPDAATAPLDAVAPPPVDAAAAPDTGAGFQCPGAATCTAGTVAGPDCVP